MDECHANDCPMKSYTATSCACGFTARLARGETSVARADRGQGGKGRYFAPHEPRRGALMDPALLKLFLSALSARAKAMTRY